MHVRTVHPGQQKGKHFSMGFCPSLIQGGPSGVGSLIQPGCTCMSPSILHLIVREAQGQETKDPWKG